LEPLELQSLGLQKRYQVRRIWYVFFVLAKDDLVAIGGQTLVGLSACTGYSYSFVMGELVPVKWRFLANAVIFAFSLPTAGVGPAVSTAFILHTDAGWRWCYYFLVIANLVPAALYAFFYFPPTFRMKHGNDSIAAWVKNFDFIGLALFTAGLILFILGIQSGGVLYPWKSGQVISMIVVGLLCLVGLFIYEALMPLKEPLIPMHVSNARGVSRGVCIDLDNLVVQKLPMGGHYAEPIHQR
jgi:MFS family permease